MTDLIARIKEDEGFRAKPYRDSRGFLTVGYGLNLDVGITEEEASWLLQHRLEKTRAELKHRWHPAAELPAPVVDAIVEAAYQLGVDGLLGFHRMLAALGKHPPDYETAIIEARDSPWQRQTPHRVDHLVDAFRSKMRPNDSKRS